MGSEVGAGRRRSKSLVQGEWAGKASCDRKLLCRNPRWWGSELYYSPSKSVLAGRNREGGGPKAETHLAYFMSRGGSVGLKQSEAGKVKEDKVSEVSEGPIWQHVVSRGKDFGFCSEQMEDNWRSQGREVTQSWVLKRLLWLSYWGQERPTVKA